MISPKPHYSPSPPSSVKQDFWTCKNDFNSSCIFCQDDKKEQSLNESSLSSCEIEDWSQVIFKRSESSSYEECKAGNEKTSKSNPASLDAMMSRVETLRQERAQILKDMTFLQEGREEKKEEEKKEKDLLKSISPALLNSRSLDSKNVLCFICGVSFGSSRLNTGAVLHMGLEDGEPICPQTLHLSTESRERIFSIANTPNYDIKSKYELLGSIDLVYEKDETDINVNEFLDTVEVFLDDVEREKNECVCLDESISESNEEWTPDSSLASLSFPIDQKKMKDSRPSSPETKNTESIIKDICKELTNGVRLRKVGIINDRSEAFEVGQVLYPYLAPRVFTRDIRSLMRDIRSRDTELKKVQTNDRSSPYLPSDLEIYFYGGSRLLDSKKLPLPPTSRSISDPGPNRCASMEMDNKVTPVYLAAQEGNLDVLKYLVNEGKGDLLARAKDGMSPLHASSQSGFLSIVKWMIEEQGIDINYPDNEKATPLHYAASRGHTALVKWLLKNGAVISKDKFGKTPLNDASETQNLEILSILASYSEELRNQEKSESFYSSKRVEPFYLHTPQKSSGSNFPFYLLSSDTSKTSLGKDFVKCYSAYELNSKKKHSINEAFYLHDPSTIGITPLSDLFIHEKELKSPVRPPKRAAPLPSCSPACEFRTDVSCYKESSKGIPRSSSPPPPPPPPPPPQSLRASYNSQVNCYSHNLSKAELCIRSRSENDETLESSMKPSQSFKDKKNNHVTSDPSLISPLLDDDDDEDEENDKCSSSSSSSSKCCVESEHLAYSDICKNIQRKNSLSTQPEEETHAILDPSNIDLSQENGKGFSPPPPPPPPPPSSSLLYRLEPSILQNKDVETKSKLGSSLVISVQDLQAVQLKKRDRGSILMQPLSKALSDPSQTYKCDITEKYEPRGFKLAKNDLIAELKLSHNVGGVSKLRYEQAKYEKEMEKENYNKFLAQFTMENYLDKVPLSDPNGIEIPKWKREMMAKKAADKSKEEAMNRKKQEDENRKLASIPAWKRQLLEKKQEDPKRNWRDHHKDSTGVESSKTKEFSYCTLPRTQFSFENKNKGLVQIECYDKKREDFLMSIRKNVGKYNSVGAELEKILIKTVGSQDFESNKNESCIKQINNKSKTNVSRGKKTQSPILKSKSIDSPRSHSFSHFTNSNPVNGTVMFKMTSFEESDTDYKNLISHDVSLKNRSSLIKENDETSNTFEEHQNGFLQKQSIRK